MRDSDFPIGAGPEPPLLPSSAIPTSATYEMDIDYAVNVSAFEREIDLVPPLGIAKGRPARLSLILNDGSGTGALTLLCHVEITTTDGQKFRSLPFTVFMNADDSMEPLGFREGRPGVT